MSCFNWSNLFSIMFLMFVLLCCVLTSTLQRSGIALGSRTVILAICQLIESGKQPNKGYVGASRWVLEEALRVLSEFQANTDFESRWTERRWRLGRIALAM